MKKTHRTKEQQADFDVLNEALRTSRGGDRFQKALDGVVERWPGSVEVAAVRLAQRDGQILVQPCVVTPATRREAAWELIRRGIEALRPDRQLTRPSINAALDALPEKPWSYTSAVPQEAHSYLILAHAYIWRDCTMERLAETLSIQERTIYTYRAAAIERLAEKLRACEQAPTPSQPPAPAQAVCAAPALPSLDAHRR